MRARHLIYMTLLALLLRLPFFASRPVSHDEQLQLEVSSAPTLAALERTRRGLDLTPPFYSLALRAALTLGDSPALLRALSLLAGLTCVPVAWLAGRLWVGRTGAWVSAVAVAVSPPWILYSREARSYSSLLLWVLVLLVAGPLYVRRVTWRTTALLVVASVLCSAWQYSGPIIAGAAQLATLVWAWRRRRADRRFLAGLGLACAASVAMGAVNSFVFLRPQMGYAATANAYLAPYYFSLNDPSYAARFLIARPVDLVTYLALGFPQAVSSRTIANPLLFVLVAMLLIVSLWLPLASGALVARRSRARGLALLTLVLASTLAVVLGAALHLLPFGATRHCLFLSPGLFLLFSLGVQRLHRLNAGRYRSSLAGLLAAILLIGFRVQATDDYYDVPVVVVSARGKALASDPAYFLPLFERSYRYHSQRDVSCRWPGATTSGSWNEGQAAGEIENLLRTSSRVWVFSEGGHAALVERLKRVADPRDLVRSTNAEAVLWVRKVVH